MKVKRGQIVWAELPKSKGSKQNGVRPCVVIQNNVGNRFSTTTIVVPTTTKIKKTNIPTHFIINEYDGIKEPSMVLAEQPQTIDELDIKDNFGYLREVDLTKLNKALSVSVGLH